MKPIGSIYPIYHLDERSVLDKKPAPPKDTLALARQALYLIAAGCPAERRRVLLPAVTPKSVVQAFEKAGCSLHFYPVTPQLQPDAIALLVKAISMKQPGILLVQPAFGLPPEDPALQAIASLKQAGWLTVAEKTPALQETGLDDLCQNTVAALHKWYPMPDGAQVTGPLPPPCEGEPYPEYTEYAEPAIRAMALQGIGQQGGDPVSFRVARTTYASAVAVAEKDGWLPRAMSWVSAEIYQKKDETDPAIRLANARFLAEKLPARPWLTPVFTPDLLPQTPPLAFPILAEGRAQLTAYLEKKGIYTDIWVPATLPEADEQSRQIAEKLLCLPLDERYTDRDMERIVNALAEYAPEE